MIRKSTTTTRQEITYTFSRAEVLLALERRTDGPIIPRGDDNAKYSIDGVDDSVVITLVYTKLEKPLADPAPVGSDTIANLERAADFLKASAR